MAKLYNNFVSDTLMSFGKSFSRLNGQPLDKSEIWFSFDDAQAYARTDAAYVGQKIAVIDSTLGTVTHYSIKNEAGDLEELGSSTAGDGLSIELNGKVLSLKNWGKKYYKYVPAVTDDEGNVTTEATYTLTDGFIDGLELKVRAVGDGTFELAYFQPNPTTVEGLQSALTAVQEAAQSAKEDAADALAEAQKKVSDVQGKGAVEVTADGTDSKIKIVGIKLDNSGNVQFSETATGLKAEVEMPTQAEYSIKKLDSATEGYSASYQLTKDGTGIGAVIDIPKDMVVQSGTVVENPDGYAAGTYIELVLANAENTKLYINVSDLIEYVTSGSADGDMVFVTVSADHKVTATITDGTITKAKLHPNVQTSLGLADTAVQSVKVLGKELTKDANEITVDEAKAALGLDAEGIAAYETVESLNDSARDIAEDVVNTALAWGNLE